jgi:hypothetical protein
MATSIRRSAGACCAVSCCGSTAGGACGSTYRVEVDHIIARARGEFGREYQWMPRNLQILRHEHNQEKMIKFDDWRPLWARVLMPVRDHPGRAAQKFDRRSVRMNTAERTPLRHCKRWKSVARVLSRRTQATGSDPATACVTIPASLTRASTGPRGRRWAGWRQ